MLSEQPEPPQSSAGECHLTQAWRDKTADESLKAMPVNFPETIHASIAEAVVTRLSKLKSAWDAL